jgi:hypothetical protein
MGVSGCCEGDLAAVDVGEVMFGRYGWRKMKDKPLNV